MTLLFSQAGAVPLRVDNRTLEVLLVSTRGGNDLTIPKGLIDPGQTAREAALLEAYEEAGVRGRLLKPALGVYRYRKRGAQYEVKVFAMEVTRVRRRWPESSWRHRIWIDLKKAPEMVKYPGLRKILHTLPKRLSWRR